MLYDPVRFAAGFPPDLVESSDVKHKQIIFADLHGNAVGFLMRLEAHGIMELNAEQRIKLSEIYKRGKQLTPEDWDLFESILKQVKVNQNKTGHLLLLGDVLGDRGNSDLLTILVLQRLQEEKINVNILFSNHDLEFLMWFLFQHTPIYLMTRKGMTSFKVSNYNEIYLYKGSQGIFINFTEGAHILPPGIEQFSLDFNQQETNPQPIKDENLRHWVLHILYEKLTPRILVGGDQYRQSLISLIVFSDRYPERRVQLLNLIENVYKPILKVKDYSLNLKKAIPTVRLDTHAPSGTESLRALAKYYRVNYDESTAETLFNCIDEMNKKFAQEPIADLAKRLHTELQEYIAQNNDASKPFDFNPDIYPLIFSAWNTEFTYLKGFMHKLLGLINNHGHSGAKLTPWRVIKGNEVEGINMDFDNKLGHMHGGPFGAPGMSLGSFINDDDLFTSKEWRLNFPLEEGEMKEEKMSSEDVKTVLRAIQKEIMTTDWPDVGGFKIRLDNGQVKIVPLAMAKMLQLIMYYESHVLTAHTVLRDIQKIAAKVTPAFFDDKKIDKSFNFYKKFTDGGEYSFNPDSSQVVTIKLNNTSLGN